MLMVVAFYWVYLSRYKASEQFRSLQAKYSSSGERDRVLSAI